MLNARDSLENDNCSAYFCYLLYNYISIYIYIYSLFLIEHISQFCSLNKLPHLKSNVSNGRMFERVKYGASKYKKQ